MRTDSMGTRKVIKGINEEFHRELVDQGYNINLKRYSYWSSTPPGQHEELCGLIELVLQKSCKRRIAYIRSNYFVEFAFYWVISFVFLNHISYFCIAKERSSIRQLND